MGALCTTHGIHRHEGAVDQPQTPYDNFVQTCALHRHCISPAVVMPFLPAMTLEVFESIGFTLTRETPPIIPIFSRKQLLLVMEHLIFQAIDKAEASLTSCAALIRRFVPHVTDDEFHAVIANCLAYNYIVDADKAIEETVGTSRDMLLVSCLLAGDDAKPLNAMKRRFIMKLLRCGEELCGDRAPGATSQGT